MKKLKLTYINSAYVALDIKGRDISFERACTIEFYELGKVKGYAINFEFTHHETIGGVDYFTYKLSPVKANSPSNATVYIADDFIFNKVYHYYDMHDGEKCFSRFLFVDTSEKKLLLTLLTPTPEIQITSDLRAIESRIEGSVFEEITKEIYSAVKRSQKK